MINKKVANVAIALDGVSDNMTFMFGGFGLSGIPENAIAELVKPQQTSTRKNTKYGIGVGIANVKNNVLRYSHSGGGMGATAYLLMYPEKDMVICILTNLSGVNIRKIVGELEDVFIE